MSRTHSQSWHSWLAVNEIEKRRFPFYALIVCAMKNADDENLAALKVAFPGLFEESQERYNNSMGMANAELEEQNKKPLEERITAKRFYEILKEIEEEFK